jgi:protein-S-isoprenylcysteine O-methyltransferase Ste14
MKEKNGEHPFGDAGQMIFAGLFFPVWVADSFFLRGSTFLSDFIPLSFRLAVMALVLAMGIYLSWSGHTVISRGQKAEGLKVTGAFRCVRHPLYLASMLFYLGLAISTASLFSLALLAAAFLFYNLIADYEEQLLEEKFGNEYLNYKNTTGRWIPGVCAKEQPNPPKLKTNS